MFFDRANFNKVQEIAVENTVSACQTNMNFINKQIMSRDHYVITNNTNETQISKCC